MVCTTRATPSGGSVSPDARARPGTKRVTRTPSAGRQYTTSSMVGVIRGRDRAAESGAAASAGLRNIQPALGDLLLGVDERQPHDCGGMAGLLRQALHVDPLARRAVLDRDHGQPDVFLK